MTIDGLVSPGVITLQTDPGVDVWTGWGSVITSVAGIVLVLVLAAVLIWQIFKTMQTRMTTQAVVAQDQACRDLAARATAAQESIAAETSRISAEISDIKSRVAAMEKLLRDVE